MHTSLKQPSNPSIIPSGLWPEYFPACLPAVGGRFLLNASGRWEGRQRPAENMRRFTYPSPTGPPTGLRLNSTGGPCLSLANWSAFRGTASERFNVADLGEHGFGHFCLHTKDSLVETNPKDSHALRDVLSKRSPAGRKPASFKLSNHRTLFLRHPASPTPSFLLSLAGISSLHHFCRFLPETPSSICTFHTRSDSINTHHTTL